MDAYLLDFQSIDKRDIKVVGGKGANLGELVKIEGINVPKGFCISTKVYKELVYGNTQINILIEELSSLTIKEEHKIKKLSSKIRNLIEEMPIPKNIAEEVRKNISKDEFKTAYAVRSSATAEDLPIASFAGQQDTFLNVIGEEEIIKCISKCLASLFTERAVIYRMQNGFDHKKVYSSVIIQNMVQSEVSGILFTADPITSNRKVLSIDAGFGLGEDLVSGVVNSDNYKVLNGEIIDKKIKNSANYKAVLTNKQILELESIGRKIEKHFGDPQDVEWCLRDNKFHIVQSRPITTLYPIPKREDKENHVYASVGHQQMMTDPLKPLGISFYQLIGFGHMYEAGGRLFVDISNSLSTPSGREGLLNTLGESDPLTKDALLNIMEGERFKKFLPYNKNKIVTNNEIIDKKIKISISEGKESINDLIRFDQDLKEKLRKDIQTKSGNELFDFILESVKEFKKFLLSSKSLDIIMCTIDASKWINKNINRWLKEKNVADTLTLSVENNITSEMGLELLDVADKIRPYPEIINYLKNVKDNKFLEGLLLFHGGKEVKNAIEMYIKKYGMRCSGEIDITRTRWGEDPLVIIPMILNNIKGFKPNASKEKFEQGLQRALEKEKQIIHKLKELPDGEQKATETKEKIDIIRSFSGYREYPKYSMISHFYIYKEALLKEGEKLLNNNIIKDKDDIFYLTFEEFHNVVCTKEIDYEKINKRKEKYLEYKKLTPPRIITSDGEIVSGKYKRSPFPENSLVGLPVSSGIIEGRARVILNMENANLEEGDILVTVFTDPSWTPLFVSIKGLVTEVGGLMTHGSVIAREYGISAVVGVENAVKLIKDGQRIRVNGTEGYIEIL